jgi:hypothetical protein
MISPLAYRQVLQTATLEAVRQSAEGGQQVAREQARRHALELRQAEEADEVHDVAEVSVPGLTERRERGGHGHGPSSDEEEAPAEDAEKHLDFLA